MCSVVFCLVLFLLCCVVLCCALFFLFLCSVPFSRVMSCVVVLCVTRSTASVIQKPEKR